MFITHYWNDQGSNLVMNPADFSEFVKVNAAVCFWRDIPQCARVSSFTRFLDHTQRRTTVGRTPLDESSSHHRELYLTTHNTHNRQTSMPPVGFVPTVSAGRRPQTYALDRRGDWDQQMLHYSHKIVTTASIHASLIHYSFIIC